MILDSFKHNRWSLVVPLVAFAVSASAFAQEKFPTLGYSACTRATPANTICILSPLLLSPTQMSVGFEVVAEKREKMGSMSPSKQAAYLSKDKHLVPVVIDRWGRFFPTDHHHFSRAAAELKIPFVFVKIQENLSALDDSQFWRKMIQEGKVHAFDENGNFSGVGQMLTGRRNVLELKDDPFRSLATRLRNDKDAGSIGWDKVGTPFEEFRWAAFLRKNLKINGKLLNNSDFSRPDVAQAAFANALELLKKLPKAGENGAPVLPPAYGVEMFIKY